MDTSVPTGRSVRPAWSSVAGTWVLRAVLVAGSLVALRSAGLAYRDALERSVADFSALERIASARAIAAYALVALGAFLFTLACRVPLRRGVSWGRLVLGGVPLLLSSHLVLFLRFPDALGEVAWAQPFYFWNEEGIRWVMLALVGVAIGTAIGRSDTGRPT